MLRSCARAVPHRPPATTRRPPLPSSASSGRGDAGRHHPQAHPLRARSSPAHRSASRCRGGAGRWAIRWAKPCRIGPHQAQRRALTDATIWADLQAIRGLDAPRTPCFTRERTLVRNQPRPSRKGPISRHFVSRRAAPPIQPRLGVSTLTTPVAGYGRQVSGSPSVVSSDTRGVAGSNPATPIVVREGAAGCGHRHATRQHRRRCRVLHRCRSDAGPIARRRTPAPRSMKILGSKAPSGPVRTVG
jgi:hypothetical protein